jgi:predicted metal-dependent HD superfamily phosphohydrolase
MKLAHLKHLPYLAGQWRSIHASENVQPDWKMFWEIIQNYSEPGRYYHAVPHLVYVLKEMDRLADAAVRVGTAKLAGFFHDKQYFFTKGAESSEQASAREAVAYTKQVGFSARVAKDIDQLIIGTQDHLNVKSRAPLWLLMNDADLAILAAPDNVYLDYARNIWREYSAVVGREAYCARRIQFLNTMIGKKVFRLGPVAMRNSRVTQNVRMEIAVLENDPSMILVPVKR